jgi:hypothetical protein
MAGLLNSNIQDSQLPQDAQSSMQPQQESQDQEQGESNDKSENIKDPILQQVEDQIEQAVPPELKSKYDAIVVAGMNVMFSKQTSHLLDQQLAASNDVVGNISDGISKLMVMVFNESKQNVKDFAPAAGLASITLMAMALDYAEQAKGVQITPEIVAECTKKTMMKTAQKFGITGDQMNQVMQAGQQQGGQPQDQQGAMQGGNASAQPQMGV